ncbi:MAG: DUF4065 domain-containing protein [Anaerovoracaceae bacterium]
MEKNYTASEIAKWFLAYNRNKMLLEDSEYISNLKLQKLLYYAQGTVLAITGKDLFLEPIVAWRHGPVVEAVYHEYKSFGASGIEFEEEFDFNDFEDDVQNILENVYDCFGQYSAWKLRNMTHEETPWINTAINSIIDNDVIKEYFLEEYVS